MQMSKWQWAPTVVAPVCLLFVCLFICLFVYQFACLLVNLNLVYVHEAAGCVCLRKFCSLVLVSVSVSVLPKRASACAYLPANYRNGSCRAGRVLDKIYGPPAAAYIIESDVY